MAEFITGFRYALGGFRLLAHPAVRLIMFIPLLVNVLLFALIIIYGTRLFGELLDWLIQQWAWLEWMTWLLWPLFLLLMLGIVFFSFTIVANLIAAPFNGHLALAVAQVLGAGPVPGSAEKAVLDEMRDAVRSEMGKVRFFVVRGLPLLVLSIVPFLQLAAPLLWFIYAIWMIALEYIEIPLGNRGMQFAEVREIAAKNRRLVLGFGSGILLLTVVPGLNLIVMPAAVAGATRMALERLSDRPRDKIQFA